MDLVTRMLLFMSRMLLHNAIPRRYHVSVLLARHRLRKTDKMWNSEHRRVETLEIYESVTRRPPPGEPQIFARGHCAGKVCVVSVRHCMEMVLV